MGRGRTAARNSDSMSRSNTARKETPGHPLDVASTEESGNADLASISLKNLPTGQFFQTVAVAYPDCVDSAPDSDRQAHKDGQPDMTADAARGAEPASPATGAGVPKSNNSLHAEPGKFTQQIQRLRARLQSVVQGVREVAQSLDEPHTLIANVRDQLQSRQEATARRSSQSNALTAQGGPPSLSRNSSISRTSIGGIGPFRCGIPEGSDQDAEAAAPNSGDAPASPYEVAAIGIADPGTGNGSLSVRARVAAVERRSRSSGGIFLEPLLALERAQSMGSGAAPREVGSDGGKEDAAAAAVPMESLNRASSATANRTRDSAEAVARADDKVAPSGPAASEVSAPAPAADSSASDGNQQRAASAGGEPSGAAPQGADLSSLSGPVSCEAVQAQARAQGAAGTSEASNPSESSQSLPPGLEAAIAAHLAEHPETLRELWTLRARVREQEAELAAMVKQLSTKNAQLDQVQTTVLQKDKELAAITRRLSGVLNKLQGFQATHHNQQQELHILHALQQHLLQGSGRPSSGGSASAAGSGGGAADHPNAVAAAGQGDAAGTSPSNGDQTPSSPPAASQHTPLSVAATRAQLLAGIPEGDSVICFNHDAGVGAAGAGGVLSTPFDAAPTGCGPLTTPLNSVGPAEGGGVTSARRSLSARNSKMLSLRSSGPSLEVSLPPPPRMWSRSGHSSEDPDDLEADEVGEAKPGEEDQLAAGLVRAQQLLFAHATAADNAPPAASAEITTMMETPRQEKGKAASSAASASPVAVAAATAARSPSPAPGAIRPTSVGRVRSGCLERDSLTGWGSVAVTSRPLSVRRRRGGNVLGRILSVGPSLACMALLMRDRSVRQGIDQLRRGVAKNVGASGPKAVSTERRASPSRRAVTAATTAARSMPVDVSRYLPQRPNGSSNKEAFESQTSRECQAQWCSIIRPPSSSTGLYY